MTNEMPERIYTMPFAEDTPIFKERDGGYAADRNKYHPDQVVTEYTRSDLCVPQDILRQVAVALSVAIPDTQDDLEIIDKAINDLQPYLKEKP